MTVFTCKVCGEWHEKFHQMMTCEKSHYVMVDGISKMGKFFNRRNDDGTWRKEFTPGSWRNGKFISDAVDPAKTELEGGQ